MDFVKANYLLQTKTTMTYHLNPSRMALLKKRQNLTSEDVEKTEFLYTVVGNGKVY
jgi:hypothetical protein